MYIGLISAIRYGQDSLEGWLVAYVGPFGPDPAYQVIPCDLEFSLVRLSLRKPSDSELE